MPKEDKPNPSDTFIDTPSPNALREIKTTPEEKPLPGEIFARNCPKCGVLKMTADQTGKTPCRACSPTTSSSR